MKDYGLSLKEDTEVDMGLESDGEEAKATEDAAVVSTFALQDSDDEASDSDDEMGDEYEFDITKMAQLVKAGADRAQLAAVCEEAMAAALERKLAQKRGVVLNDAAKLAAEVAAERAEQLAPTDEKDWDLDGRMTPGQMTPPADDSATPARSDADDLAARAQEALASANARRRRSSAAKRSSGTGAGIVQAMEEAKERRRKSLAKMNCSGEAEEDIQAAMEAASRRHRKSMSKAADILEDAGYDEEGADCSEAAKKMRLVQQAMEDARKRHRKSIAEAVSKLNADAAAFHDPRLKAEAAEFTPILPTVQTEQASIWPKADSSNWCSQDGSWSQPMDNNWVSPSQSVQNRITQAVSNAYQDYQENWQQHGYDQTWDQGCPQQGYMNQGYGCDNSNGGQQNYMQNGQQQGYSNQGCMPQSCGQQGWSSDCQGGMQQNYMQQNGDQQGWSNQNCQQGMMQQGCTQQGFMNQNCQQGYADQYNCGGQYAQQQDCQQYGQYAQNGYQGQGDGSWQHGSQNCGNWSGSATQAKDDACWNNAVLPQSYNAPWRLGSA